MPVDFNRVPPRVTVPAAPKPSILAWGLLLAVILAASSALSILLWPKGTPVNTLRFVACAAGYPVLGWAFLLVLRLLYGHVRRSQALATNRVSDEAEAACHRLASVPLAILGQAWCFSSNAEDNAVEGVQGNTLKLVTRNSAHAPDKAVRARWIELPASPFFPGNALAESARHRTVLGWILNELIGKLEPQLKALRTSTRLKVQMHGQTRLKIDAVEALLREQLTKTVPFLRLEISTSEAVPPLFATDAWVDNRQRGGVCLFIAVQLRNAISELISDGLAEAGAALLVGPVRFAEGAVQSTVRLHRPAQGSFDNASVGLDLAVRWGRTTFARASPAWSHGVADEQMEALRPQREATDRLRVCALEHSVGNCSGAGSWLALAFAAECAHRSEKEQLVIAGEGDGFTTLVCRTKA